MKNARCDSLAAGLLLLSILLLAPPGRAQDAAPDSSAQEETTWKQRRWGIGVQSLPIFGLSVRYALTRRLAAQVAAMPVLVDGNREIGARLVVKLHTQPTYNFYVAAGSAPYRWAASITTRLPTSGDAASRPPSSLRWAGSIALPNGWA